MRQKIWIPLLLSGSIAAYSLTVFKMQSRPEGGPFDFEKAWQIVDSLKAEGQPRAAADQAEQILDKALQMHNDVQIVKAHLYRIALWSQYIENYEEEAIKKSRALIVEVNGEARQVLHMTTARLYYAYYNRRQWELGRRQSTNQKPSEDIREWSPTVFEDSITAHYLASLHEEKSLSEIPARIWSPVLDTAAGSTIFRPTLFDVLAWEALEYFKNERVISGQPISPFPSDHPALLGVPDDFNRLNIQGMEGKSNIREAFIIFQRLSRLHSKKEDVEALMHVTLERLDFALSASPQSNKDTLFSKTLHTLKNIYKGQSASAWILLKLADLAEQAGNPAEALKYCEEALKVHPHPYAEFQLKNKIENLQKSYISITCQPAIYTSSPALISISWKNSSKAYFRIYRYSENKKDDAMYPTQEQLTVFLHKHTPIHSFEINLPDSEDYKTHITEWLLPTLEKGFYLIAASTGSRFDPTQDPVSITTVRVTRLNMATQNMPDGSLRILVADRKSGKAVAQATATLFALRYNYIHRYWERQQIQQKLTDKKGQVFFKSIKEADANNYSIELSLNGDTLFYRNVYPEPIFTPQKTSFTQLQLFTDRAIYRPGQTLYYKGILITRKGNDVKLIKNKSVKIGLIDANGREVISASHRTNAFGSLSGSFVLPATGLNGNYTLLSDEGSLSISVEDYRRPVFEINLETAAQQYKTGEKVEIKGLAKAFAGYPISEAIVKYRVMRIEFHPWYYGWKWHPYANEQLVAAGETRTDADGQFTLSFHALGQRSNYYRYRTEVSVTDLNGETRQTTHELLTGPSALVVALNVPEKTDIKNSQQIAVTATNLEGKPVPAQGFVTVYRLRQPEGLQSERPGQIPDRPIISKNLFKSQFPFIPYGKEQDFSQWPIDSEVKRFVFDTQQSISLTINDLGLTQIGVYKIIIKSSDAYGQPIENTKYTVIYDDHSSEMPYRTDCWFTPLSDSAEPGQRAHILVGSSYRNVRALVQVSLPGKILQEEWIVLNNEQKNIEIPILEEYRGNLSFQLLFFAENKIYYRNHIFQVPFSNKELHITTENLPRSTEPGAEETFRFRIRNADGKPTKAEVVAVMYDASLDVFRKATWNFFPYNAHFGFPSWKPHDQYFMPYRLDLRGHEMEQKAIVFHGFDRFNFFGYPADFFPEIRPMFYMSRGGSRTKSSEINLSQEDTINEQAKQAKESPAGVSNDAEGDITPRDDFRETAFFIPHLETDEEGRISINSRMPESLTRWKIRLLTHDSTMAIGYLEATTETRKPLMVVANPPRFLHTGDTMIFPIKIVNLSAQALLVNVRLSFEDALTGKSLSLTSEDTVKFLTLEAGSSASVSWKLSAPNQPGLIYYTLMASAGKHNDGVQSVLPVISSRKPVINTWALYVPAKGEKSITTGVNSFKNSNLRITFEVTGNPAWYAIQSLPDFDEPQWESALAYFQTWYIQKLGLHILERNPNLRQTINLWKNFQPEAFESALRRNKELKIIDLEETPFANNASQESFQKARLAQWIEGNHMEDLCRRSLDKIKESQLANGGFSWFKGMPDSRLITLDITKGFARLKNFGALSMHDQLQLQTLLSSALKYLDEREWEDYQEALKRKHKEGKNEISLSPLSAYWLYIRALWGQEFPLEQKLLPMYEHYIKLGKEAWKTMPITQQGMMALIFVKNKDTSTAQRIIRSLRDRALHDPAKGMYWARSGRYNWYESGIFSQAVMIEAFTHAGGNSQEVEAMKQWLLFNKRTQMWDNKTATMDALAALMLRGENLINDQSIPRIELAGRPIEVGPTQAGTQYFKISLTQDELTQEIDPVRIINPGRSQCWAGIFARYETEMDKTEPAGGGIFLRKEVYVERQTPQGLQLMPVTNLPLVTGDRLVIRLIVDNSQDMEYVYLKDYHAAGTEPLNVISGYQWQNGIGFYQSTRDEATHFFIQYLPEGKHIFEYRVDVFQGGNFTAGFAEIQCQYAPEFSARSASVRLKTQQ